MKCRDRNFVVRTRGLALMCEFGNEAGARQGAQAKKAKLVSVCVCLRVFAFVCVCVCLGVSLYGT